MKFLAFLFLLLIPISLPAQDETAAFKPPLYAFENGVRYGSADEGVRKLRELGYDGIGSIHVRGKSCLIP